MIPYHHFLHGRFRQQNWFDCSSYHYFLDNLQCCSVEEWKKGLVRWERQRTEHRHVRSRQRERQWFVVKVACWVFLQHAATRHLQGTYPQGVVDSAAVQQPSLLTFLGQEGRR
ncbi:unnamed protein product [Rodentolepis nana]|uniref:Uncharacterized protein n=1 Tax=Rodentolepis nana TaxID=102285 RepID=A0A3P7RWZ1_RODNA|nr:unnamed protein product [Rodentolepis nana]